MTEMIQIVCDHDGGRLLPEGHRATKGPVFLDNWFREETGGWGSLYEETVVWPHPLDASREHERTIIDEAEVESKRGAKLVDPRGQIRLRGGVTRTKRGYRFECPACPTNRPVRNPTLQAALDAAAAAGRSTVTLNELQHAGAPHLSTN